MIGVEWSITQTQAPALEPIGLQEAKDHVRVDHDSEDALIKRLITAARRRAEQFTRRAFITQTWELHLDAFPAEDRFVVPKPPLRSVTSITYDPDDDTVQTLDADVYRVDTNSEPGRIILAHAESWPDDTLEPGPAVTVTFENGYGDEPDDVPSDIIQGILMDLGHLYEHRETVIVGQTSVELPLAAEALLWPYRAWV